MNDSSHNHLVLSENWPELFEKEKLNLEKIFSGEILDIQHIGSTSVKGMLSKPIIDIAVLVESVSNSEKFLKKLEQLGYFYDKPASSSERHFLRKGNPTKFHLSIAFKDQGGFWGRQIQFRDYLRSNPESVKEYEKLKQSLLEIDPTGRNEYISGKSDFIENILKLTASLQSPSKPLNI